jgi:hypothetical protein
MRFLVRLVPHVAGRAASLSTIRSIAANLGARAVNAKWTSYGALEIDIFADSMSDFELVLAAIGPLAKVEFAKDLQEPPRFLPKELAIDEAVALFDAERYWEAHEVLESLWRVAEGDEKRLLQGLILVCAAFVHHQKDEEKVALGVARRAIPLLVWNEPRYLAVDVAGTREVVTRMVEDGRLAVFKL